MRTGSALRGPVVVGDHSEIGSGASVGSYTSVGSHVKILRAAIENSIILDRTIIDCRERIADSIIGRYSKIVSDHGDRPSGRRFVVGESAFVSL